MIKKLLKKNEFLIAVIVLCLALVIGTVNRNFFTVENLFDMLRSSVEMSIFAIGVLIVIISGGIDISFSAIAAFSMYATTKILLAMDYQGSVFLAFAISALIGLLLGLINAFFISTFKLPTFIVTLGTQNMYRGFLLAFIGTAYIIDLPKGMIDFSKSYLIKVMGEDGTMYGLHSAVIIVAIVIILGWFILNYTMIGRGIYAMGGDMVSAERAGFNITALQVFIYGFVGLISGLTGIIHASIGRIAKPFDLVGNEMNIIAAVVLGGARVSGGHGTVLGTILGVILVTLVNNSLILLHIPTYWQKVAIGIIILIGIGLPTYQENKKKMNV